MKKDAKSLQMAKSKAIKSVCYKALKTAEKTSEKVKVIDRLCDNRYEKISGVKPSYALKTVDKTRA